VVSAKKKAYISIESSQFGQAVSAGIIPGCNQPECVSHAASSGLIEQCAESRWRLGNSSAHLPNQLNPALSRLPLRLGKQGDRHDLTGSTELAPGDAWHSVGAPALAGSGQGDVGGLEHSKSAGRVYLLWVSNTSESY
jgi:hypothetical protein